MIYQFVSLCINFFKNMIYQNYIIFHKILFGMHFRKQGILPKKNVEVQKV